MAEGKTVRTDLIVIIMLLGTVIAGFWMTGSTVLEGMEVLNQKAEILELQNRQLLRSVADMHEAVRALKGPASTAGAAVAPAPSAAPVKPASAPAKK